MKQVLSIVVLFLAFTFISPEASGQIKIDLKKKINKQADTRANKNTDKALDKGFDKMEDGIKGIFKKKDDKASDGNKNADDSTVGNAENQANENNQTAGGKGNKNNSLSLTWNKYDFVPGDKIIFEDNLIGEENGEFPSRWDLMQGNVEIAQLSGENVIMFRAAAPRIIPYLKNPEKDYLPDVFTVEFDLFFGDGSFEVFLYDLKNQRSNHSGWSSFRINPNEMGFANSFSKLPGNPTPKMRWAHIAIAYTSGKLKGYIDETRLVNIPHLNFDPTGITFSNYIFGTKEDGYFFVKNIRIAEGGVKYYDRFLQDGKIVSNGIRFDVGKATLRPESMGVINEIFTMLNDHPDVAVSIEGHTDSDGDNDLNQKLSEDRAETVMKQLVSMGLSKDRLSFRGYGESKPVAPNDTPEGKASNRRVEFVKNSGTGSQNSSISMTPQANVIQKTSNNSTNYQPVTIGTQVWMQQNLDVANFRNGDPIPQAKSAEEWQNMRYEKKASWCYYNFSATGEGASTRLYNWFAVNDSRGLAPEGWRIPTAEDWDILRKKLGMGIAGKKMKSNSGWNGKNGTNASGFNGQPGFYCDYNGVFTSLDSESYWWGSDDDDSPWSPSIFLDGEDDYMHKHQMSKGSGLFVRCIK